MKKFQFRLQKVLDYRRAMEERAQDAYLDSRVARLEAEAAVAAVDVRRRTLLSSNQQDLSFRQTLELMLLSLDDEERQKKVVVEVLADEERKALQAWQEKKQELEALVKLREKAEAEYGIELNRYEQAQLDEWTVQRREA